MRYAPDVMRDLLKAIEAVVNANENPQHQQQKGQNNPQQQGGGNQQQNQPKPTKQLRTAFEMFKRSQVLNETEQAAIDAGRRKNNTSSIEIDDDALCFLREDRVFVQAWIEVGTLRNDEAIEFFELHIDGKFHSKFPSSDDAYFSDAARDARSSRRRFEIVPKQLPVIA